VNQTLNQNPEQIARDKIDSMLIAAGWLIQNRNNIDFNAGKGIAVRHYPLKDGTIADYILFVDCIPLGVIEAKKAEVGHRITTVEEQSYGYAQQQLKYLENDPLPYVYESTGEITHFTDYHDPKARSRDVFSFFRPETFREWKKKEETLRYRLLSFPELNTDGLRSCQINAIQNLEKSFSLNKPRALVQMATGAGKTFTAITSVYRLLKFADAKRILFLVDTRNLGEQAEQEFMSYIPNDDNRNFTELYGVHRLTSNHIPEDSPVIITTIQRLYSILKGEENADIDEDTNPGERVWQPKEPLPVVYNSKIPPEFFDFIIIDECHRSIYNLWRQILDYFDAFHIGLTATPDKRTYAFFNENLVSEYTHEQAVADDVNVGYDVFLIETDISKNGAVILKGDYVDKREKLTRKKRWEMLDDDITYTAKQLDKDVVNHSQIRNIMQAYKNNWKLIFPGREEVPKTLIYAKDDSHADDIIKITREVFDEGNAFCKKITYKSLEDTKTLLAQYRNAYNPRIAVTVDMIATGTDVKPLECLIFMRDVRSRNYFEQMKGRGTRTISKDDLRKVSKSAESKSYFVIIDAVGVTTTIKTDSRPLERKPNTPLKDLLEAVTVGSTGEDLYLSLANRLTRLSKQIDEKEHEQIEQLSGGVPLKSIVHNLLNAYDIDFLEQNVRVKNNLPDDANVSDLQVKTVQKELQREASHVFNGKLNAYLDDVRKFHEQVLDITNIDHTTYVGWDVSKKENAKTLISDFKTYIETHKDEITALKILYSQPYRRREMTYDMIKELFSIMKADKPILMPARIWQAYESLEKVNGNIPEHELTALVSLLRRVVEIDKKLTPFEKTVDKNFKEWIFKKHSGTAPKFTLAQMDWLRMIRDAISTSFHIEKDDFNLAPFDAQGGIGKMWQLFGKDTDSLLQELNEALNL